MDAGISFGEGTDKTVLDMERDDPKWQDIEQYRGSQNRTDRISLIVGRALPVKYHWEEGMPRFYCFDGACCKASDPKVRFIVPIIQYTTNADGKIVSPDFEIKYLLIPSELYKNFRNLAKQEIDVTRKDFIVTCSNEKMQKLAITPIADAAWRKEKAFEAKVLAEAARLVPKIRGYVAKTITAEDYAIQRGEFNPPKEEATDPSDEDLSQMFKVD